MTSTHTDLGITTESFTPVVRCRCTVDGVGQEGRGIEQLNLSISHDGRGKAEAVVPRYPVGPTHPD